MDMYTDRDIHIDAILRRFDISLEAAAKYNSGNRDEIKNAGEIFRLNGRDKEKTLALLYMVSQDGGDGVIRKFRGDTGLTDERHYSPAHLVTQYGTMLAAALIYHPQLYAMAVNYHNAVNAGFTAAEITEDAVKDAVKKESNIIPFRRGSRTIFATAAAIIAANSRAAFAAAAIAVVFSIAFIIRFNQRIDNDLFAAPQMGPDRVSFVSYGNEGARVEYKSPNLGKTMGVKKSAASRSVSYYNKLIKKEKNNAALYVNRGVAYILKGRVNEAISDFNKAVELEPDNTSAYFNRSAALMVKGDAESAIADIMTVISKNPDDSEAYYALGTLYYKQYLNDAEKPRVLIEKSLEAFKHIEGYRNANYIIYDFLAQFL